MPIRLRQKTTERESHFWRNVQQSGQARETFTGAQLLTEYRKGRFVLERASGIAFFSAAKREIATVSYTTTDFARRIISRDKDGNFGYSVDRNFKDVLRRCAMPWPFIKSEECWLRDRLQDSFKELHAAGHAHSIELWRCGELVGGLLGLQQGAAFTAVGAFAEKPPGEVAILVATQFALCRAGFDLYDCVMPSVGTNVIGAGLIDEQDYFMRLRRAQRRFLSFPALPVTVLSPVRPFKPQLQGPTSHGGPFPR